jgi:site-specific DNA-methyltransferase (adenine-specific)
MGETGWDSIIRRVRDGCGVEPYHVEDAALIYCCDNRLILPLLERGSVDLVLTDPPYGIGFSKYESHIDSENGYIEWLWPTIATSEQSVADGWCVVFQAAKRVLHWSSWFPRQWRLMALPKSFGQILPSPIQARTDYALFWRLGEPSWPEYGSHNKTFFRDWFLSDDASRTHGTGEYARWPHPCPRPLDLMRYLVQCFARPGSTILDPFLGSGTTAVAAKQLGRRCIGIEIEEKYCAIARDRLRQEVLPLEPDAPQPTQAAFPVTE